MMAANFDEEFIRPLVRDLHKVNRSIFWADFGVSALLGWAAFGGALFYHQSLAFAATFLVLSVLCLYRSLCFVHELSHQTDRSLGRFEDAYNFLAGFPLLLPSFTYVGMHQSHHRIDLYGTEGDPEYLPFSQNWLMTTVFAAESVLIPVVLLLRFVVLGPLTLISSSIRTWCARYLSSLTMNPKYRRTITPQLISKIRRDTALLLAVWCVPVALSISGLISWRWLLFWFIVNCSVSFINTVRTLGAHAYESDGEPMDRISQLCDSIDHPGAFWTELWAPVGLRYHALHHFYPGIPYHNLPEAYRRIVRCISVSEHYRVMSSESLPRSLVALLKRGSTRDS